MLRRDSEAMGSGGSFEFLVEEDFSRGHLGRRRRATTVPLWHPPRLGLVNFEIAGGLSSCATVEELSRGRLFVRGGVKAQAQAAAGTRELLAVVRERCAWGVAQGRDLPTRRRSWRLLRRVAMCMHAERRTLRR